VFAEVDTRFVLLVPLEPHNSMVCTFCAGAKLADHRAAPGNGTNTPFVTRVGMRFGMSAARAGRGVLAAPPANVLSTLPAG
jgi:hypothetical protein